MKTTNNLLCIVIAACVLTGSAYAANQPASSDASTTPEAEQSASGGLPMHHGSHWGSIPSPLVAKVRSATTQYRDVNAALAEGWVQGTPCVSGPDKGAMGVHFVFPPRIKAATLQADQPEALIYEPQSNGALRLVGVEYIILSDVWQSQHNDGSTPALEGQLLNYVGAPNRYGLPAFYELHIWAWENNPMGSFADWNTHVTCEKQSID